MVFVPITLVKVLDIHSDAEFHALYPDDVERAHQEAAKAMEDCPFCHIQFCQFIVSEICELPPVRCEIIHEYLCYHVSPVVVPAHSISMRAPPVC